MVNTIIEYIDPIQVKKVIDTEIYELSDDNKAYDYIRPVSISFTNVRDNYYKYYNTNYNVTWDYTLNATDPINVKDVNVAIYYYKSGSADNLSVVTAFAPLDSKSTQWTLPNMVETGSYYFQMDIDYANEIFTIISDEFKVIEPVNPVLKMNTGSMMLTASYNSLYKVDFVVDKYNSDILDSVDVYYTTDGDYVRYTKLNNSPITLNPGNVTQSYSEWVIPTDMMPFRLKVSGKSKIDSTEIFVEYPKFGESKIPIVQESFDRFLRILDIGTYIDKYSVPPTYSSSTAAPKLDGSVQFVFHKDHKLKDSIDIYVRLDESKNIWTPVKLGCDLYNHIVNPNSTDFITGSVDIDFSESILYPDSGKVRFKLETRTVDSNYYEPPNIVLYYDADYRLANDVVPPVKIEDVIQEEYTQNGVTITPAPNVIYYDLTSSLVNIPWETNENMSDIYTEYVDLYYSTDNPPTNYLLMDNSIRFYSGGTTSTTVASGSYNWKLPDTIGVIPTSSLKLVVKEKRTGKEIVATKKVHILKHDQGFHGISDLSVVNLSQTSLQRPKKFDNTVLYYGDDIQLKFKRQGQYLSGSKIEILVDDPSLDIVTHTHTKLIDSYGHPAYKISGLNPVWETPEYLLDGTYVGIPAGDLEYPLPIKIRVTDINRFTLETYEQIYYGQLNKRNLNVDIGDISEIWSDINDTLRISWYGDGLSKNFNIDLVSGSAFYPIAQNLEFQNSNYSYEFKVKGIPLPYDTNKFKVRVTSITPSWVQNNIQQVVGESAEFTMHIPNLQIGGLSNMVSANALSGNVSVNVVNDMGWKSILGFLLWSIDEFLKPKYILKQTNNINVPQLKLDRSDAWGSLMQIQNEYDSDGALSARVQLQYQSVFNSIFSIMSSMYEGIIFTDAGKQHFYTWFYSACIINKKTTTTPNVLKKDDGLYIIDKKYIHTQNAVLEYYKLFKYLKESSFFQTIESGAVSGSMGNTIAKMDDYINYVSALDPIGSYIYHTKEANYNNYQYYTKSVTDAGDIINSIVSNNTDVFLIGDNLKLKLSDLKTVGVYHLNHKCLDTIYTSYEILNYNELVSKIRDNSVGFGKWSKFVGLLVDTVLTAIPTVMSDHHMRVHYQGGMTSSVQYALQTTSHNYTNYVSSYYQYVNASAINYPKLQSYFNTDKFNDDYYQELPKNLSYANLVFSTVINNTEMPLSTIESDREVHFKNMLCMLHYFVLILQKTDGFNVVSTFYESAISIFNRNQDYNLSVDDFRELVLLKNTYLNAVINACKNADSDIFQTKLTTKQVAIKLFRYMDRFVTFELNTDKYTLYEVTKKILHLFCSMNNMTGFNTTGELVNRILDYTTDITLKENISNIVSTVSNSELGISITGGADVKYKTCVQKFVSRAFSVEDSIVAQKLLLYPDVNSWLISAIHDTFTFHYLNQSGTVYGNLDRYYGNIPSVIEFIDFFKGTVVGKYGYNLSTPRYNSNWNNL